MFDRIYQGQSVLARHRDGPWADERTRFLQHVANEGCAPSTLMNIAAILLAVAHQFDGRITGNVTVADIAVLERRPAVGAPEVCVETRRHSPYTALTYTALRT